MVLYVPCLAEGQAKRWKGPSGTWLAGNRKTEDSGQQDAEPALAGEPEEIAEADST